MIYLLSQMSFIILLAVIAGVALGWGFHRLRTGQTVSDLRNVVAQQQQQVKQAHTEVKMAAEDYDELKQLSSRNIETLRAENRQIPNLHQNLEKSQLLVRQLMQKHELQIRQYGSENESMKTKLKNLDDRESAINRLQSDVERERRKVEEAREALEEKSSSKPVETPVVGLDTPKTTSPTPTVSKAFSGSKTQYTKPEEINDTQQTIVELTEQAQAKAQDGRTPNELLEQLREPAQKQSIDQLNGITGNGNDSLDMSSDISNEAGSLTVALAEADIVLAAIDKKRENSVTIEDDEVIDTSVLTSEFEFADEDSSDLLFDPVEQHDDLQTIFGIGPVFERSLNKLGITSYSQLAELQHHDIEKLAVALEIVPGKIERENWVGNARRQLEDVLEEL